MLRFKDINLGKRIWVCGGGGSLLTVIPEKIPKQDIVICCNVATKHFENFDYAVFTDSSVNYYDYYLNLNKKNCKIIIFNEKGITVKVKDETYYIEKEQTCKFDKTSNKSILGRDCVHIAVNLAWMMGAKEIILAGVDLKYINENKKYAYAAIPTKDIPSGLLQINKYGDAGGQGKQTGQYMFDGYLGSSLMYWDEINEANPNLNIVDISIDGNLKLYPKKSFNEVISY